MCDPCLLSWIVPADALVPPGLYLAGAVAAAFLIGLGKAGFGGGVGTLATPLLLVLLPGPTALSLMLPVLIGCDVMTLRKFPRDWDRRAFWALALWMFLGLFLGLALLVVFARLDSKGDILIRLSVGIVVATFTILSMLGRKGPDASRDFDPARPVRRLLAAGVGLACGITTMIAHAAGVLLNLFLLSRRPSPAVFVGTTARFYLSFNLIKVPFFIAATSLADRTFLTWNTLVYSISLLPAGYLGVALGAYLNRNIPKERYLRLVNIMILITGLYLVVSSSHALKSAP